MKILVGSLNPEKLKGVNKAFEQYFSNFIVYGFDVKSQVSKQPIGDEIFIGANNRCNALIEKNINDNLKADYFIGIEGGLVQLYKDWFNVDCVCIKDKNQKINYGLSPLYCLDKRITDQLLSGEELGVVFDKLYGTNNSKQTGGVISFLTNGITSRSEHCYHGTLTALIKFL